MPRRVRWPRCPNPPPLMDLLHYQAFLRQRLWRQQGLPAGHRIHQTLQISAGPQIQQTLQISARHRIQQTLQISAGAQLVRLCTVTLPGHRGSLLNSKRSWKLSIRSSEASNVHPTSLWKNYDQSPRHHSVLRRDL